MTDISNEDIALVEDAARKFIKTEVAPHLDDWEEAGEFPRSLYPRAAEMGWPWATPRSLVARPVPGSCAMP